MRVTDRTQVETLLRAVNDLRHNIFTRQEQISSGRRINRPSDDPAAGERVAQFKNVLRTTEKRLSSVNEGIARLSLTDSTLATVGHHVQKARELAIQARNDTLAAAERANIGKEIDQLFQSFAGLGNTQLNGRALFAGHETASDPFVLDAVTSSVSVNNTGSGTLSAAVSDVTALQPSLYEIRYNGTDYDVTNLTSGATVATGVGSPITFEGVTATLAGSPNVDDVFHVRPRYSYLGDGNAVEIEVDDGKTVATNISGSEVFSGPDANIFTVFQDFHQALMTNDEEGIASALNQLDLAHNQVINARGTAGAQLNRLDTVKESLSLVQVNTETLRSSFEDTDLAKVASELATLQVNLEASMSVLTRQFNTTLLNFLR